MITTAILSLIRPKTAIPLINEFVATFNEYYKQYGLDSLVRVSSFVGNMAVESNFKPLKEFTGGIGNSYYVKKYWDNQEKAKSLGNKSAQDAIDFCGKGYLQLTGRSNYEAVSHRLFGDDRLAKNPDLLLEPKFALLSAFEWWKMNNMNAVADKYGNRGVAAKINTGSATAKKLNHLPERMTAYNRILDELKKKIKFTKYPFGRVSVRSILRKFFNAYQ